jgi:hypothetical protein
MVPMKAASLLLVLFSLALLGCSAATHEGAQTGARDLITQEELDRIARTNAYEAVRNLRPAWLRDRGQMSFQDASAGQVIVYLDNNRFGAVDMLRQISVADVSSIRFLSPIDAGARFGMGHAGGAILVTSRQQ